MSTEKNPIAKTEAYVEKHDLKSKVTIENGLIKVADDIFETTALMDAGLTLDQANKLSKAKGELINGVTFVAGGLVHQAFKENDGLTEVGYSFTMGQGTKVSGLYNRDAKDHVVVAVETTHRNAEFNRVATHLNSMFNDINS